MMLQILSKLFIWNFKEYCHVMLNKNHHFKTFYYMKTIESITVFKYNRLLKIWFHISQMKVEYVICFWILYARQINKVIKCLYISKCYVKENKLLMHLLREKILHSLFSHNLRCLARKIYFMLHVSSLKLSRSLNSFSLFWKYRITILWHLFLYICLLSKHESQLAGRVILTKKSSLKRCLQYYFIICHIAHIYIVIYK